MAEAANSRKQTKRERQRAAAEARAVARKRQEQRRTLAYVLGGVALIAVVVLAVLAFTGGDEPAEGGVRPSAAGDVTTSGSPRASLLEIGEAVPDFSAPGIGGDNVGWSDFAGSPAVVSVWAPWCPHCQVELPLLSDVMQDFGDVEFLTVVTAIGDSPGPDAGEFLREHGITAPTAVDDAAGTLAQAFGIQGFPTLFFVNSDGTVAQALEGEVDAETLRAVIGSLS
jgi:thiol-disulfide isomerase/thioredoxin